MNIPKELKYSRDHEWVRIEGKQATVGITDFAQLQLGDVVFVEVPILDSTVAMGQGFAVVESVKAVSDIYASVAGVVVKVNEALADAPEIMNQDPYGEGWLAVIEMPDGFAAGELLDSKEYEKLTAEGGH